MVDRGRRRKKKERSLCGEATWKRGGEERDFLLLPLGSGGGEGREICHTRRSCEAVNVSFFSIKSLTDAFFLGTIDNPNQFSKGFEFFTFERRAVT